jgi:hypothetical protein
LPVQPFGFRLLARLLRRQRGAIKLIDVHQCEVTRRT